MAEIVITTSLSSVHMVPEISQQAGPATRRFLERAWYAETLGVGDSKLKYFEKVQTDQLLTIQIHASTSRPMRLELYGTGRLPLASISGNSPVIIPDFTYQPALGGELQLYTHTVVFSPSLVPNLQQGIYWLRATLEWDKDSDGVADYFQYAISEPLHIRARWEKTVLIDCRHDENDEHFIWLQTGAMVSFRTEGKLSEGELLSEDESYDDSLMDSSLQSSFPYESWFLETAHLPAYARLRLHHALSCKYLTVDRRGLTKGGGKLEVSEGSLPLRKCSITLRETAAANNRVAEFMAPGVLGNGILIIPAQTTFPAMIHTAALRNVASGTKYLTAGQVLPAAGYQASLLTALNNGRTGQQLHGRFEAFGGDIYYLPHPLEDYTALTTVLTKSFVLETSLYGAASTTQVAAKCVVYGIQWDNGDMYGAVAGSADNPVSTYTLSHTYPNPGANTADDRFARVFFKDEVDFEFQELIVTGNRVTSYSGQAPAGLIKLTSTGGNLPSFNFNFLAPAVATIAHVLLPSNQITTITNYVKAWPALETVDLSGNKLSSVAVDQVINDTSTNVNSITNSITDGTLSLNGQQPPAPPTGASASSSNDLTANYSWLINTD